MRAARLLHILLLLQNRGRMTCGDLAGEVEVTTRTILRDVDAMTEAGLPIIVHRGSGGGIELGFNYRTRLTGLATEEAEALGVMLGAADSATRDLGIGASAARAKAKLIESFPDGVRQNVQRAMQQFCFVSDTAANADPRVAALARAVRQKRVVRINAKSRSVREIHPVALVLTDGGWAIADDLADGAVIALSECGDINISRLTFGQRR